MPSYRNAAVYGCLGIALMFCGQERRAFADDDASRWLTPTMINARAHMLEPSLNFLTFQHMDQMFAKRKVAASDHVWELPSKPEAIEGEFEFNGRKLGLKDFLEATATNAFLVIKDGNIIHETYRNGSSDHTRFMSFSVSKSYVATLIGFALADGAIKSLDDKVIDYLPQMKSSAYDGPTIRDLLRMRSGVEWQEVYQFGSETQLTKVHDNSLVGYKYRWCDYAATESKPGTEKPGAVFNYATLDTSVLGCVLEKAVGKTGAEYMSEKLWKPAGMESDAYWIMDGPETAGREFFGAGLNATARDHARFGLMFLNGGIANGKQVVPAAWVKESTVPDDGYEPTAPGESLGYQYQWWTIPNSDAYLAIGLYNQFIFMDPKTKTVIVKLDATPEPLGWEQQNIAFFQKVSASLERLE